MEASARGFSHVASTYEASRPEYPRSTVNYIASLAPRGGLILDLAAGTGKLTRMLAGTGREVVAVEPIEEMRSQLSESVPAVTVLDGLAESIPIGSSTVDLVTVAQAFHWFDSQTALTEIKRVLKSGGSLAIIYNKPLVSETNQELWAGVARALRAAAVPRTTQTSVRKLLSEAFSDAPCWSPVQHISARFTEPLCIDDFVELTGSSSFAGSLRPEQRATMLNAVRESCRGWLDRGNELSIDWLTDCYITSLSSECADR
ncbi:class I SAM-dependent methyltransferase [Streptomyces sp. NPDC093108]|uniref:class I SAM-dependent methyltransferase n=1 Tax=Streptomyces sp. NPDC093108 TaxID=3366030 RepID=UPI003816EE36